MESGRIALNPCVEFHPELEAVLLFPAENVTGFKGNAGN
jgi:hypothetical protein